MVERHYQDMGLASPSRIRSLWREGCEFSLGEDGVIHVWYRPKTKAKLLKADKTPGLVDEKKRKYQVVGILRYQTLEDVVTFFWSCGQRIMGPMSTVYFWTWERRRRVTL